MYLNHISKSVYYLIFFSPILILGLSYYLTKKVDCSYLDTIYVFFIISIVVFCVTKKIIKALVNKVIDLLKEVMLYTIPCNDALLLFLLL